MIFSATTCSVFVPRLPSSIVYPLKRETLIPSTITPFSNSRRVALISSSAFLLSLSVLSTSLASLPPSPSRPLAEFFDIPSSGGVKALDIRVGAGESPAIGDQVAIHYYGRLAAKQGWRFDSTYDHKDETGDPVPFVFVVGSGKVISGIEAAIKTMKVGGVRRVIIPPSQGYQNTSQEPIPPNFFDRQRLFTTIFNPTRLANGEGSTLGTLIFDIELGIGLAPDCVAMEDDGVAVCSSSDHCGDIPCASSVLVPLVGGVVADVVGNPSCSPPLSIVPITTSPAPLLVSENMLSVDSCGALSKSMEGLGYMTNSFKRKGRGKNKRYDIYSLVNSNIVASLNKDKGIGQSVSPEDFDQILVQPLELEEFSLSKVTTVKDRSLVKKGNGNKLDFAKSIRVTRLNAKILPKASLVISSLIRSAGKVDDDNLHAD